MKKYIVIIIMVFLVAAVSLLSFGGELKYSVIPVDGVVPDEITAIRIAQAVWIPIYGEKKIDGEKPFHAKLKDGIWTVQGSLPEGDLGGVAVAEIAKSDGRIIRIFHDQ